jgi:hypothetical protein
MKDYKNIKYGDYIDNLNDFIDRMQEVGFEVTAMFPYYEGRSEELLPCDDIGRQALNYEHVNIDFTNEGVGTFDPPMRQTISVMLTGDKWCDIVPINDWTFRHGTVDYVDMFLEAIRKEWLGEDA